MEALRQENVRHYILCSGITENTIESSSKYKLVNCDHFQLCRFHKLVWGSYGIDRGSAASGLLMGGAEHGELYIWDPAKIISEEDSLVHKFTKHTGPVAALDINPFQVCENLTIFNKTFTIH